VFHETLEKYFSEDPIKTFVDVSKSTTARHFAPRALSARLPQHHTSLGLLSAAARTSPAS